jgi:VanZ family protein
VGYFVLSVLLFRAWKATLRLPALWALRWSAVAFFMSALVASMDEWHQTYLPSRTGAISDVLLDSSAALTAQIVIFLFLRAKTAKMAEEVPVTAGRGN